MNDFRRNDGTILVLIFIIKNGLGSSPLPSEFYPRRRKPIISGKYQICEPCVGCIELTMNVRK